MPNRISPLNVDVPSAAAAAPEGVRDVIEQINDTAAREGRPAIVFSSIVDDAMSETIRRSTNALSLDLFQVFIAPLENELGAKSSHAAGRSHGIANSHAIIEGPAILEQMDATTVLEPGDRARSDSDGNIIIDIGEA